MKKVWLFIKSLLKKKTISFSSTYCTIWFYTEAWNNIKIFEILHKSHSMHVKHICYFCRNLQQLSSYNVFLYNKIYTIYVYNFIYKVLQWARFNTETRYRAQIKKNPSPCENFLGIFNRISILLFDILPRYSSLLFRENQVLLVSLAATMSSLMIDIVFPREWIPS